MAMRLTPHPWFEAEMLVGMETSGYRLRRIVGVGGFGAVYLTQGRDGEDRVVKVLYPPDSKSTEDMKDWGTNNTRFLREMTIVERFDHPNIIKIHDIGNLFWHFDDPRRSERGHDDHSNDYLLPFYVAEYLPDGLDLHISANQLLEYRDVVLIGAQICNGLSVLHHSNPPVLHRDLNPRNIRLADGNRPVITDFGVASYENTRPGDVTTELRRIIPPDVAAPEQLAGEEPDARTDIYQVGALLLAMLTGKFPRSANVPSLLDSAGVRRDLSVAIRKCLAYEKEGRFQDVLTLRTALLETRPPAPARPVLFLARLLGEKVHGWILNQLAGIAPPFWRRREFWFSLFTVPLIIVAFWSFQPNDSVEITIANSSAKKEFMAEAFEHFNKASQTDGGLQIHARLGLRNKSISVQVIKEELEPGKYDDYRSGSMVRDILSGKIRPTIASPAEHYWIEILTGQSSSITTREAIGVANTPFVIAMWRSRAVALGCWPSAGPECTWAQLDRLAHSPDGWGMVGHPEWGRLKFGEGYPGRSNSGTLIQMFNCMSGLKKIAPLTIDDIRLDNGCGQEIAAFDKAVTVIRERSEDVLTEMRQKGPELLDAAATNEHEVIKLNQKYSVLLAEPIVAVYPQDGIIMNAHPFAILDAAPWVPAEQVRAAEIFREFLLSPEQQSKLGQHGFRPANPTVVIAAEDREQWRSWGANPDANLAIVELPSPQVIEAILKLWEGIRTPR